MIVSLQEDSCGKTVTHGEGHVKMEMETEVMHLQARGQLIAGIPPEARNMQGMLPLQASEGAWPC